MNNPEYKGVCAADIEPRDVEFEGNKLFVRNSINCVQGVQGEGKSFFLLAICAAKSAGGSIQSLDGGKECLDPGVVLYLSAEDDQ